MRIHGRISTIDAPVVPIAFDSNAPNSRKITLVFGVASPLSVIVIPPEITKSEPTSAMNETYSLTECHTSCAPPGTSQT